MKREGKQHGMVRTYRILPNPKPGVRFTTRFDSPPPAGLFTKVPSKPTNHSKFTSKCNKARCPDCHLHPVSKSKNKSKGSFKQVRVIDHPDLKFNGLSATGTLNYLSNCYVDDDEEEDESAVDNVDYYANNLCPLDDEKVVGYSFPIEQDKEENFEDESVDHVDCNANNSCTLDEKEVGNPLLVEQVKEEKFEDESVDHVDHYANNSCTLDEKEVGYPLLVEQVNEDKYVDEDWILVECCS